MLLSDKTDLFEASLIKIVLHKSLGLRLLISVFCGEHFPLKLADEIFDAWFFVGIKRVLLILESQYSLTDNFINHLHQGVLRSAVSFLDYARV